MALAAADVSTGRFVVIDCSADALGAELARLGAARWWPPKAATMRTRRPACGRAAASTAGVRKARLKALFGVATLDGFGSFSRAGLAAAGGLVAYLEHTAKGSLPFLRPPQLARAAETMAIDAATRESLELTCTTNGQRKGQPARLYRPDGDGRGRTGAGERSWRAADGCPSDRRAAGFGAALPRSGGPARAGAVRATSAARYRARHRRLAAGVVRRAIWGSCATGWTARGTSASGWARSTHRWRCSAGSRPRCAAWRAD